MPNRIQHVSQTRNIVPHTGRCINMHRQNRLDPTGLISTQHILDLRQIDTRLVAIIKGLHRHAQALGHLAPCNAKPARRQHQNRVTGTHHIVQRGLPCGMAVANINRNALVGHRHRLQIGDQPMRQIVQLAFIYIGRRTVHFTQHRVGDHRRTRNSEIGATVCKGHFRELSCAVWADTSKGARRVKFAQLAPPPHLQIDH